MAAFTSKANGNWAASGQTTWNEVGVPGAGDTATIAHNVTITADTVIGDGTNSTVLTCATGTVTVTGAALTIKGKSLWGGYVDGTVYIRLTIQNSGATPGGIEFDANSGVTPQATWDYTSELVITGTSSARCFVRTKSGSAGNNGTLIRTAATTNALNVDAQYADFTRLGNSGVTAIYPLEISVINSYQHCNFDNCGAVGVNMVSGSGVLRFNDCNVTNPLDTLGISIGAMTALTSGTREVLRNNFRGQTDLETPQDLTIRYNNFFEYIVGNDDATPWALFSDNFVRKTQAVESLFSGGSTNSFFLVEPAATSMFHCPRFAFTMDGNVSQGVVTGTGGMSLSEGGAADRTITFVRNLSIRSSDGGATYVVGGFHNGNFSGNPFLDATHNTALIDGAATYNAMFTCQGILSLAVDTLPRVKSNLAVRIAGGTSGTYLVKYINPGGTGAPALTDALRAVNADYNAYYGLGTVPAGSFSGTSGDTDVEAGSVYYSPMSGSTAPGVHDVKEQDPQFVDSTRTIETWAVTMGSVSGTQAGKRADAYTYLAADPLTNIPALVTYIKNGFKVRNPVYKDAGHDGVTIGAMGFQSGSLATLLMLEGGMHGGMNCGFTGGMQRG